MNISVDDLPDVLADIFEDYSTKVTATVDEVSKTVADELRDSISKDAPRKTGTQADSWEVSTPDRKTLRRYFGQKFVVHSDDYRKVHLLENGHVTRDGTSRTKAIGYVSKNEEAVVSKYPERLAQAIRTVK